MNSIIKRGLLLAFLTLLCCSACGTAQTPAGAVPAPDAAKGAPASGPVYTNLDSAAAVSEVRALLTAAGIEETRTDAVLAWAADYNGCMRTCASFTLAGEFTALEDVVDYGDYSPMSQLWFKTNGRNYHDILCRIAAFQLAQPLVSVGTALPRDAWDCWDPDISWLWSDGDVLFGREAGEGGKAYAPFPLLDWDEKTVQEYFTLFNPITVSGICGPEDLLKAVQAEWTRRQISFQEADYALLTLWIQSEDRICAAHAAVLAETAEGVLLFEKTNPESPYSAAKFASAAEAGQYLIDMLNLDDARYGMEPRTCAVLRNDRLLE